MNAMKPIQSTEPTDKATLAMIARSIGPIQAMVIHLGDADLRYGVGIIDRNTKCLWTKDGRRIEICMAHGAIIASLSKEADPGRPELTP